MKLSIQAADVTVRNCLVLGGFATGVVGLIDCRFSACKRFLMEDCTAYARTPSAWINGAVMGHDFTVRRCDISGVTDGIGVYNTTGPDANVVHPGQLDPRPHLLRTGLHHWQQDRDSQRLRSSTERASHPDRAKPAGLLHVPDQRPADLRKPGSWQLRVDPDERRRLSGIHYSVVGNWFHGGDDGAQLTLRTGPGEVRGNVFDLTGFSFGGGPPPSRYQIRLDAALVPGITGLMENRWPDGRMLTIGRNSGIRTD
jgi:hypothetical protein